MYIKTLCAAVFAVSASFSANAGEITIHGSTTVNANLFEPYKAELVEMTGNTYNVVANGSSRGIKGIDEGNADLGMISADLEGVLRKLKIEDRASEFHSETVGEERITFNVHPSNPIESLTKEQVVSILNGSAAKWSDVGGEDKPILVVTEYAGGGFRTTVEKKLLSKASISAANLKEMPNAPQAVKVGEQVPTSFVVVPSTLSKGSSLKKLSTDAEIVQPLNIVIKGEQTEDYKKLVSAAKELLSK